MSYLDELHQTVSATLASGRIGAPVFVRWTAALAQSEEVLKAQLAEMSAYANLWLAAPVQRLYATGAQGQGHLSLTLEYDTGSSALLALTLAYDRPFINLAIYGARGAVYHNDSLAMPQLIGDELLAGARPPGQMGPASDTATTTTTEMLAAIDRSLAVNRPVGLSHAEGKL
jgi:hypothetical protein